MKRIEEANAAAESMAALGRMIAAATLGRVPAPGESLPAETNGEPNWERRQKLAKLNLYLAHRAR
jgi:hypothetical protein